MNDSKHKLMLSGFVWLATAAALPALAQNPAPPEPEPMGPPPAVPGVEATPPVYYETYCPPRRVGSVGRWWQRCRARAQDRYWGYPEEFQDVPLGTMLQAHVATSVANGQAARMALHQFDFVPASDQLKPRGKAQVAKIAAWAPMNAFLVFVEPSTDSPELDEARRQTVWLELSKLCPIASERVVVGYPASRGLEGVEAQAIDRNRLSQTSARGIGAGAAAGSSGSPGVVGGAAGVETTTGQ